jgi:hypothetical protein
MQLNITLEIPEQQLRDFLTTAWEGGIDYWCDAYNPKARRNKDLDVERLEFTSPEGDDDFNEPIKVANVGIAEIAAAFSRVMNEETLAPGLRRIIQDKIINRALDDMDLDAGDCDNLVQIACFGDIIYG